MSDPERCLQRAREADRLAALVSYERDRARLLRQAAEWRARAAEAASSDDPVQGREEATCGPLRRFFNGLIRPGRRRDG